MKLRKNIIANYFGQGWVALMGFIFIPLYIKYLGMEAYGIIGFFAILQAWLGLMDFGIGVVINREFAGFEKEKSDIVYLKNLLRSAEVVLVCIGFAIFLILYTASDLMATYWLNAKGDLSKDMPSLIGILGIIIGLKIFEGIYRSAIIGMQRQIEYNLISALLATLRGLGAVFVLMYISPSMLAFFYWQLFISIASVFLYFYYAYAVIGSVDIGGRFSFSILKNVGYFSAGVIGFNFLTMLLTQLDKIYLSYSISLIDFGYYVLAATVAGLLNVFIGPISQALFPRLCELKSRADSVSFSNIFRKSTQLATIILGSLTAVVFINADLIILTWTQDLLISKNVSTILSVLVLGTFLNCIMWLPFQVQMSYGSAKAIFNLNMIGCMIMLPAMWYVVPLYGSLGVAWAWLFLNIFYLTIGAYIILYKVLGAGILKWYIYDIAIPFSLSFSSVWIISLFKNPVSDGVFYDIFYLAFSFSCALICASLAVSYVRGLFVRQALILFNSNKS